MLWHIINHILSFKWPCSVTCIYLNVWIFVKIQEFCQIPSKQTFLSICFPAKMFLPFYFTPCKLQINNHTLANADQTLDNQLKMSTEQWCWYALGWFIIHYSYETELWELTQDSHFNVQKSWTFWITYPNKHTNNVVKRCVIFLTKRRNIV